MPSLLELQAEFLKWVEPDSYLRVDALAEADGIWFLCPKCYTANGGSRGTHAVVCWFEGRVPDTARPGPGRWNPRGTGLADLSFVPGRRSNSVLLTSGCRWHGFIGSNGALPGYANVL